MADATRAARDLTMAAARFTERMAANMKAAAEDPKEATRKAARRVAHDLDAARDEIERALRDL